MTIQAQVDITFDWRKVLSNMNDYHQSYLVKRCYVNIGNYRLIFSFQLVLFTRTRCASMGLCDRDLVSIYMSICIRECGSTLYVHPAILSNTNFQITFLLTHFWRHSMKTYLYRASNLKFTITFLAQFHGGIQFLATAKNHCFLQFNHNNHSHNPHQLLQTGFVRVY